MLSPQALCAQLEQDALLEEFCGERDRLAQQLREPLPACCDCVAAGALVPARAELPPLEGAGRGPAFCPRHAPAGSCPILDRPAFERRLATARRWLERRAHAFPLEEWAALLLDTYPRDYTPPPLPQQPAHVASKRKRIKVMQGRCFRFGRRFSEQLFHPDDSCGPHEQIGILAHTRRNGRVVAGQVLDALGRILGGPDMSPTGQGRRPRAQPRPPRPPATAYERYVASIVEHPLAGDLLRAMLKHARQYGKYGPTHAAAAAVRRGRGLTEPDDPGEAA